MPGNRLSALFEQSPRKDRSTTALDATKSAGRQDISASNVKNLLEQRTRAQNSTTGNQNRNYNARKPLPALPNASRENASRLPHVTHKLRETEQSRSVIPQSKHHQSSRHQRLTVSPLPTHRAANRSNTAPRIHPPDELFLTMIHRRSANARLEEIQNERDFRQKNDPALARSFAIACAMPPDFLEAPPPYSSLIEESSTRQHTSRSMSRRPDTSTIRSMQHDELFFPDSLSSEIHNAIAQLAIFEPVRPTPGEFDTMSIISPLNDIDQMYLERRRIQKQTRAQRI